MSFVKYAAVEAILEIKTSKHRLDLSMGEPGENLAKFAKVDTEGDIGDGYMYVRARAISSRVNKNNDGWPSEELANAYKTFIGRPIFVDHNNDDPRRTRGVIVDAKLHVEDDTKTSALDPYYASAPENHKPPTWIEILMEVDGETYPKLAHAIREGHVDAVSMGANIERSLCSVCANEASTPNDYCDHISSGKGQTFEIVADNGEKVKKSAYEDCIGVNFFEESFVFDPADPTADILEKEGSVETPDYSHLIKEAVGTDGGGSLAPDRNLNYIPQSDQVTAPQKVDTLRNDITCPNCEADDLGTDPDGILRCPTCGYEQPPEGLDNPDLSRAHDFDLRQKQDDDKNEEGDRETTIVPQGESDGISEFIAPIKPLSEGGQAQGSATNNEITNGVISDMIWNRKIKTENPAEARAFITAKRKTAGVVQTFVVFDSGGIHHLTHTEFSQRGINAVITYTDPSQIEAVLSTPGLPPMDVLVNRMNGGHPINTTILGENETHGMKDQMIANELRQRGIPASEIPIQVECDDARMEEAIALIHQGGKDVPRTAAVKKVVLPGSTRKGDEPTNEQVIADQLKPVEADRRVIKREESPDGTRTEHIVEETGGFGDEDEPKAKAAPKDEPKSESPEDDGEGDEAAKDDNKPDFLKQKKKEPAFAATAGHADIINLLQQQGIGWEEISSILSDPHHQVVIKALLDSGMSWQDLLEIDPETWNYTHPGGENYSALGSVSPEKILLAAMKVAEEAVELGIIDANKKMAFIGQLEAETLDEIEARRKTLALVKNAGLAKRTGTKVARSLPRLSGTKIAPTSFNGEANLEDIPFEAVFYS